MEKKIRVISMKEFNQLQQDYVSAEKYGRKWIIQSLDRVFEDIDLGNIKIKA